MPTLTICNVDTVVKEQLRVRAARHGQSMEAELRQILKEALAGEQGRNREPDLAEAIRLRFLSLGGADDIETHRGYVYPNGYTKRADDPFNGIHHQSQPSGSLAQGCCLPRRRSSHHQNWPELPRLPGGQVLGRSVCVGAERVQRFHARAQAAGN